MATPQDIALLREYVAEPTTALYSDEALSTLLDTPLSVNGAAARIWREKAGTASGLVDVTEGNSTRKLSQLKGAFVTMADFYAAAAANEGGSAVAPTRFSRSRLIDRV